MADRKGKILRIEAPAFVAGAHCYRGYDGKIAWDWAAPILRAIVRKEKITVDEFVKGLKARRGWKIEWIQ